MARKLPHKGHHYLRAIYLAVTLLLIGLALQLWLGAVPTIYFRFPVNIFGGLLLVVLLTVAYLCAPKNPYIIELSSATMAIVFSVSIGICAIVMGSLVLENSQSWATKLGLGSITTSWYFALLFLGVLVNLWLAMLKRAAHLNFTNIVFLTNHMGLFLALYGAFLGQGDILRFNMSLRENEVEWRAYQQLDSGKFNNIELPFALYLKDFSMQTYANKLYITNANGRALPVESKPAHVSLGQDSVLNLLGYQIIVHRYIPKAVFDVQSNSYVNANIWGTTNAAYVSIKQAGKLVQDSVWVGAGNFLFPAHGVILDKEKTLVMASPEAKQFVSKVIVYQQDSTMSPFATQITVNQPLNIAGWKIYQTSYDENMGEWSTSSVVELIRDPWLPVVYTGLVMLIIGSCLFLLKIRKA